MKKLVLKASAGTGKTYRLSLEYVLALINDRDYKNILVMTFTRKATAEIRKEVLEKIENFIEIYNLFKDRKKDLKFSIIEADIDKKKKENFLNLIESIEKIGNLNLNEEHLKKLVEIYKEILKNKEKIKIYTIDAFLNIIFKSIVTNYMKIKSYTMISEEENTVYYKKVLENILSDEKVFFEFFKFFDENTEKNIDEYIKLIKKIVDDRWKYLISKYDKGSVFKEKLKIENNSAKIFFEIFNYIENVCKKDIADSIKKEYKKYMGKNKDEVEKILIDDYKNIFKSAVYNGNKFRKATDKDFKVDLDELQEELRINLAKKIYNEVFLPYEKNIMNLSEKIYEYYDEIKIREKKFTFNDISIYTFMTLFNSENLLITENGLSSNFYDEIDMKIETIFIDEFQDTSILQWKILFEIIKNVKDLICVGDEKQSIYGWRGGEKKLFENLEVILETIFKGQVESETMSTSYRSDKNVVAYTNKIFKDISDEINSDWKFEDSIANSKNNGFVKTIKVLKEESNDIVKILVNKIEELNIKDYSSIAVIARRNKDLREIGSLLEDKKIPYKLSENIEAKKLDGIFEYTEFLNYLNYGNELAILNFISSKLSNFGTELIEKILKNKNELINYLNGNNEKFLEMYPENVVDFLKKIKNIKELSKKTSPQNLTFKIFNDFNFTKIYTKKNTLKNIYEAYRISGNSNNIRDLLEAYERLEINFADVNSEKEGIELITIHKSKGLQYSTVFVLDSEIENKSQNLDFIFVMNSTYTDVKYSLFLKKGYKEAFRYCFPEIVDNYDKMRYEEEINNRYVAFTRAKNNLIIVSQELENGILGEFYKNNNDKLENEENTIFVLKELNEKKEEFLDISIKNSKFSLKTEEKRMLGLVVHYFLENIKYGKENEIKNSIKLCEKKYGTYFGVDKMKKIFSKENIEYILDRAGEIFSQSWDFIYSEYELFDYVEKKRYRIDRIMIDSLNKKVLIVDYKTGTYDEEQLKNYKRILEENFSKELEEYEVKTKFLDFDLNY